MSDIIKKEIILNSDIKKVWHAISKEEEISKWFLKADFKAQKDYNYVFKSAGEDCTKITGIIIEANPYTLIYTWIVENTNIETTVKWALKAVENGTKLTLEHSGISGYSEKTAIMMFESFSGGWDNCFNGLNGYLAK